MTTVNATELTVNGVVYVPKSAVSENSFTPNTEGLRYVIVRTYSAGVFAGYLKTHKDKEVELVQARRLWSWAGAFTLSQLSQEGTNKPNSCRFPAIVPSIILTEAIEILPTTDKARDSIIAVPVTKV